MPEQRQVVELRVVNEVFPDWLSPHLNEQIRVG